MIKAALSGGLGNQMFQYAFARNLSIKNNAKLYLNTSYLQSKLPIKSLATSMQYELDIFNIQAEISQNIFQSKFLYPLAKAEYLLRDTWNKNQWNVLQETSFNFQPEYLSAKDNTYIKGNFQSEKYFIEIEKIIRQEFQFKPILKEENLVWKQQIENSNAVSIHVRRGDYISLKQNVHKFAQIPIVYFQKAINHIASKIENPVFFVFSDDLDWVKRELKTEFPVHFISNNNTKQTSYIDMQLMSLCMHNIICNSTFSWWGAWLNSHPDKMVIAPQQWFADNSINSKDIYPLKWIKL